MAVPTLITDLSETIASNSPGGSDLIGGTLDNYLRAQAGILRQESMNKSWLPYGEAVTYVSASSFTVVDATAGSDRWYMGRALKATCTGGTVYGVIASTALSGGTLTVNVISSGSLDSGLSRVDLALEPRSVLPTRNYIINPMFRFWQRNTTFSLTASASGTKVADGWIGNSGSATGTATISRQAHTVGQTTVPFEPTYYLRWAQGVASTGVGEYLKHHVEDVRALAGKTVCLTICAKLQAAGDLAQMNVDLIQDFGAGGSPSTAVVTSAGNFLPTSTFKFYHFIVEVPSITGKTIGTTAFTDSTYIRLQSNGKNTFTVDIAGVWLNEGSVAVITPPPPFEEGLRQCQRRFFKTFAVDQVPASNVGDGNTASEYCCMRAGGNTFRYMHPLPVAMRAADRASQTATFYNPQAAGTAFYNGTGAANSGISAHVASTIATNHIMLQNGQAAGDALGDRLSVHFTLDCEFA